MSVLFDYFWPGFAVAAVIGAIALTVIFRRQIRGMHKWLVLGVGLVLAVIAGLVWSGPLGGARNLTKKVDVVVSRTLEYYEMTSITARLGHGPMTRQLHLSGPADDFQRSELARMLSNVPGVSEATWRSDDPAMPIVVEMGLVAAVGFLFGMLLAYLFELRRRHEAQWNW